MQPHSSDRGGPVYKHVLCVVSPFPIHIIPLRVIGNSSLMFNIPYVFVNNPEYPLDLVDSCHRAYLLKYLHDDRGGVGRLKIAALSYEKKKESQDRLT